MITTSQQVFKNFDQFFDQLITNNDVKLTLNVSAYNSNGSPQLVIHFNNETVYDQALTAGEHTINLELSGSTKNCLSIGMMGKLPTDTEVRDGKIIADKYISINGLYINQFDLLGDVDFYYNHFEYVNEIGQPESVKPGFWANSRLILRFDSPFLLWYNNRTSKNVHISETLQYQTKEEQAVEEAFDKLLTSLTKLTR
jgi:hypothetical protein